MPDIKLTLNPQVDTQNAAPGLKLNTELNGQLVQAPKNFSVVESGEEILKQAEAETRFTPEEQQMIDEFAEKIDINDTNMVFQYGAASQQNVASFSDAALANVRSKDLDEVGDMISGLVVELRGFANEEESKGIFGFLKKKRNELAMLKERYDSAENNVTNIANALEDHQVQLMKDISMLDQLYELNLQYFKELSMYIAAGKKRLEEFRAQDVKAAFDRANASGLAEDAQAANDLQAKGDRFEKKIHDLELTRNISIQMAPQIRLLQNNNSLMVEKIQSSLVNTIPLWKSQMVLTLGLANSESAMKAQRAVTDITNDLLKKNAEKLRQGTIETAKESERGIVDIETLKQTNQTLINTLDEVMAIQQEGREKRKAAEAELQVIEEQLKNKLLETRN